VWRLSAESMWKIEPDVLAARKLPGWATFHRVCGQRRFYFDHPVREGRRGAWKYDCFTLVNLVPVLLSQGSGKTVLEALADAHERSGRATDETRAALAALAGDDFDGLLEPDDFEGLIT
jgi:hypothetical protein